MTQVFHPASNSIAKAMVVGVVLGLLGLGVLGAIFIRSPYTRMVGDCPRATGSLQPRTPCRWTRAGLPVSATSMWKNPALLASPPLISAWAAIPRFGLTPLP